jgi:hypothetical protein
MELDTPKTAAPDQEPEEKQEYVDVEITPASDYEYLMGAINAMECMEGSNPMTKEDKQIVERIKKKSIRIIDFILNRMYDELFHEG